MSYEQKLFEVFKQLSFLQLEKLKSLPVEEIEKLYDTRPFKDDEPDEEVKIDGVDLKGVKNRISEHLN